MSQALLFQDGNWPRLSARMVPHPIPYQGSKRGLANEILRFFPPTVGRLVEPFAGSAALSLAAGFHGIIERFWLNDAHAPLMSLWQDIIDGPEDLLSRYEKLWREQLGCEREYFDVVRAKFNKTHEAACFLYLLARCVKAAIRYNSDGEFNNSPDNRRRGAVPGTMRRRVIGASSILRGRTKLTTLDYTKVLAECDKDDLIYMDPPYQGVCATHDNRYMPKIDHSEFCDELDQLNRRELRYIVSYDGRTGSKIHGQPLPTSLSLTHIEVHAGRSTQATLLGRAEDTYESIYLSQGLANRASSVKKGTLQ